MRAFELGLLILCIQAGIGLVVEGGMFSGKTYFENTLTGVTLPSNMSALDDLEQAQVGISVFNSVKDALTWGWLKSFFYPAYHTDVAVQGFIDSLLLFLRGLSALIIGAAVIEFFKNRSEVI